MAGMLDFMLVACGFDARNILVPWSFSLFKSLIVSH